MKELFGITITDDGFFLCAGMHATRHGWKKGKIRRWPIAAFLPAYFLLNRSVNLSIPGHWMRQPGSETVDKVTGREGSSFTVCTNRSEYDHFSEPLRNNLAAVYPDDSLLATLPWLFHKKAEKSYVSIFNGTHAVKLGIIVDGQFITAISCKPATERELRGHIERLRHYFTMSLPELTFPTTFYALNNLTFEVSFAERIECGSDDPDVLKAMGVAYCSGVPAIPRFGGPSPESRLRHLRLILLTAAMFLTLGTVATVTALTFYTLHFKNRVIAAKESYRNILNNNTDIRELIASGDELSRKVLRLNKRASQPTTWGPFLHLLGSKRPQGLFLERIGSEPVPGSLSKVRVALGGWCETETIATDFIKILNKSSLLSEVTLSSMERIGKDQTACRFKILCLLSTIE